MVFPLTALLAWGVEYSPFQFDWQVMAMPFLALAGVSGAGYCVRREFTFDNAEQRLAGAVWVGASAFGVVAYHNDFSAPFLTWLAGFLLTLLSLWMRGYLKVAVATPLR